MKNSRSVLGLLAVGWFASAGCKKEEQPVTHPTEYYGVKVDLLKLDIEFASASPEVQRSASLIKRYYYYSEFPRAASELEQLANDSSLSELQNKLVSDLIEQTAQVIAKEPAPAPIQ